MINASELSKLTLDQRIKIFGKYISGISGFSLFEEKDDILKVNIDPEAKFTVYDIHNMVSTLNKRCPMLGLKTEKIGQGKNLIVCITSTQKLTGDALKQRAQELLLPTKKFFDIYQYGKNVSCFFPLQKDTVAVEIGGKNSKKRSANEDCIFENSQSKSPKISHQKKFLEKYPIDPGALIQYLIDNKILRFGGEVGDFEGREVTENLQP